MVGGLGFVVDAGILTVLVSGFGHGHYISRAVSFSVAVTVTWLINRRWVFAAGEASGKEYSGYFVVQLIGAVVNLGVYGFVIEWVPLLARTPVIPLAIGAAVALLANFILVRRFVYRDTLPLDST